MLSTHFIIINVYIYIHNIYVLCVKKHFIIFKNISIFIFNMYTKVIRIIHTHFIFYFRCFYIKAIFISFLLTIIKITDHIIMAWYFSKMTISMVYIVKIIENFGYS